jgi:hypothetical protein
MNMKKLLLLLLAACLTFSFYSCKNPPAGFAVIKPGVMKDKILGGWAGQTIACTYGGPTEFKFQGTMIQDYQTIPWNDHYIKWYFENSPGLYDDVYMDLSFVEVFDKYGLDAPVDSFAGSFANAKYPLWHANQVARYNILNGIKPPASGFWLNNPHADCIDFQIEADFAGLMSPGMPNTASEVCDKVGHIMNSGDGWYGGVYVAALYSLGFISDDIGYIVSEALKTIPDSSDFHKCISDVIAWHKKYPEDWKQTWFEVERKWSEDVGCPSGVFYPYNIDAKVNCAYVVIGLLYGGGDFNKTIDIATRCGQDSDCNPATAGGILGTITGYEKIPSIWKPSLEEVRDLNFAFTDISINKACIMSYKQGSEMIVKNGGTVSESEIKIKTQQIVPVKYEKNFEGHYPVEIKKINKNFSDSVAFSFSGNGIVLKGNAIITDNKKADRNWVGKAEVYIDNNLVETISIPLNSLVRKTEIFWKYQLPVKEHKLMIKWLNPDKSVDVRVTEALIYYDKPTVSLFNSAAATL